MVKRTWLSWSSGKDSAWALHRLQQDPGIELAGLFCTVNRAFNRVAMHAVSVDLLKTQTARIGLPLEVIEIPYPCSNADYDEIMTAFVRKAGMAGVECFAFGDLFLEDVRKYREEKLRGTGISPIFPLWGVPTDELSREVIDGGVRAVVTCVDPEQMPKTLVGREYDASFLHELPAGVDPCGENGEFHTFVFDGPAFSAPVQVMTGAVVERDGFVFIDVTEKPG